MPWPAAPCSPVAPIGASWRARGRIGVTEFLVGVPFPALALEIVRFAVPARYLAEFTLSGATYATDAALERGWIDEVAEPETLMQDALSVARELALLSPPAFAEVKRQMRAPVAERYARAGSGTHRRRHLTQSDRRGEHAGSARRARRSVRPPPRPYVGRGTLGGARTASHRLQRLLQVGDDVGDVLDADRQPHHVGPGAGLPPSARRTIAGAWSRPDG